jgi:hypothetical protein
MTDEGANAPVEERQEPQIQTYPYQQNMSYLPPPPQPVPQVRKPSFVPMALAIIIAGVMISASILIAGAGIWGSSSSNSLTSNSLGSETIALSSPADGVVINQSAVTLTWETVSGASVYKLYLAESSSRFYLVNGLSLTKNSYSFTGEDGNYSWMIYAIASDGSYTYSNVSYFTIKTLLDSPVATGPESLAGVVFGGDQTVNWTSVDGALSYNLQVAYDEDFTDIMVDTELNVTSYSLTGLQANSTYYWRVMAIGSDMESQWSDVSSLTVGLEYFLIDYTWEYDSQNFTITLNVSGMEYYEARANNIELETSSLTTDYGSRVNSSDEATIMIATEIKEIADAEGYNSSETLGLTLAFVQAIPYQSDDVTTGYDEYVRYPVETLVDQAGDCDCKSVLFLSLAETSELNYTGVLLEFVGNPGHMAVGMSYEGANGTYFNYHGVKYYYCETTEIGWKVGVMPSEVSNRWSRATIIAA